MTTIIIIIIIKRKELGGVMSKRLQGHLTTPYSHHSISYQLYALPDIQPTGSASGLSKIE